MSYDLGHCGEQVQSLSIRNTAAELLRMALKPIERRSDVVRGCLDGRVNLTSVVGPRIGSEMYWNDVSMSFGSDPRWSNSIQIGRDRSSSVECVRDCSNVRERVRDCRMMLEGDVRIHG
jgi:hypothetical protein